MARKALLITLALIFALAVPALAQKKGADKKPTAVSGATAAHSPVTDFGKRWQGMADKEKDSFLTGMLTAFDLVCQGIAVGDGKDTDSAKINQNFKACMASFFPYMPGNVKLAMNSLYQDSANNQVPFDYMYTVALLKAGDKPYEETLTKLRQESLKRIKAAQ